MRMFEKIILDERFERRANIVKAVLLVMAVLAFAIELVIFLVDWRGINVVMIYYTMMPQFLFIFSLLVVLHERMGKLLIPTLAVLLGVITAVQIIGFRYSYIFYFFTLIYAIIYILLLAKAKKKGETLKLPIIIVWMILTFIILMLTYVFAYLTGDMLLISMVNFDLAGLGIWGLVHIFYLTIPLLMMRVVFRTKELS